MSYLTTEDFANEVTKGKTKKVFQFNVAEDERVYPLPIIYSGSLDSIQFDQAKDYLINTYIKQNASAEIINTALVDNGTMFTNDLFNILLLSADAVERSDTDFGMMCPNTEDGDEAIFLGLNECDPIELLPSGYVRFVAYITNGFTDGYAVVEAMPVNLCPNPFPFE